MGKPTFLKMTGPDSQNSLERFWAQTGLTDASLTARFFQLFGQRADAPGASESAHAAASAADRIAVLRAPELAAIAIPASGGDPFATIALTPVAATTASGRESLEGERAAAVANLQFGPISVANLNASMGDLASKTSDYVVLISENLEPIGIYDAKTKELLPGGPGNYDQLGEGPDDQLSISGDFSGGFELGQVVRGLDMIVLRGGNDYNFTATDDLVERGHTLTISAMPLAAGDHLLFDGSRETDGRFVFFGSDGADVFLGGAGDDRIVALGGADMLSGGGGRDTFVYTFASDSSGADYDTIGDFNVAQDRIDLFTSVSGFGGAIEGGSLSLHTFDDDLGAALAGLGANQARWFAPDAGGLAGTIFLVVDANGVAGYQAGEDYVFAIGGAPLDELTSKTDFFI